MCLCTIDVRRGAQWSYEQFLPRSQRNLDMDMALDNIVPESLNWRHTDEGPESVSYRVQPSVL